MLPALAVLILVIQTCLGGTYNVTQNVEEEVEFWSANTGRDATVLKVYVRTSETEEKEIESDSDPDTWNWD